MSTRRIGLYFLFVFLVLGGLFFRPQFEEFFLNSKNKLVDFKKNVLDETIQIAETNISTPPPLRSKKEIPSAHLTQTGTIKWTNINRQNNELPPLRENQKLNEAAMKKARDILDRQYFEHISPSGEGPQNLASDVGYSYISIGENLALGNFANDRELLEAWMASPEHRENILSRGFTEIGVAVLSGKFEGENTWVAVQEFGTPLSVCPPVDTDLKETIDSNKAKADRLASKLESKKDEISKLRPTDPVLPQKIDEYNALVNEYNSLVSKTKNLVKTYNKQVSEFNSCVKLYTNK